MLLETWATLSSNLICSSSLTSSALLSSSVVFSAPVNSVIFKKWVLLSNSIGFEISPSFNSLITCSNSDGNTSPFVKPKSPFVSTVPKSSDNAFTASEKSTVLVSTAVETKTVDFSEAVKALSDDLGTVDTNGDLGFTNGEVFPSEFEQVIRELKL